MKTKIFKDRGRVPKQKQVRLDADGKFTEGNTGALPQGHKTNSQV